MTAPPRRVVVVTGGAAGIGAAIAEALGREGAFVVTMDPVVTLDGASRLETTESTTAERIVDAGGAAIASAVSVTDGDAVAGLFTDLRAEFGSLDAVVNVAGISRPTGFATGAEDDWAAVLSVHLDGYLNVLRAALPIMEAAGSGRILGVTSGSGWRSANAGAYSCAKRAVAALTWQIARAAPPGVTVNALSPIAVTRMVTAAMPRRASSGRSADSGGLSLGSMPPPEHLGPIGAHLTGLEFDWCNGRVIFSSGAEAALITEPHLLEVLRTHDVASLPHVLDTAIPTVFHPVETAQASSGGTNPRLDAVFTAAEADPDGAPAAGTCLVVTDDAEWGGSIRGALTARGVTVVEAGAGPDPSAPTAWFDAAGAAVGSAVEHAGAIDAIVVARREATAAAPPDPAEGRWRRILDEHENLASDLRMDAAWARAAADEAARTDRSIRLVTITPATSTGGKSRAQAAAQLARAAHGATSGLVDAFAIGVEAADESARRPVAELAAHLVTAADAGALSGAELVAGSGWFGLRAHPRPTGSISFGGPEVPEWFDAALREVCDAAGVGG